MCQTKTIEVHLHIHGLTELIRLLERHLDLKQAVTEVVSELKTADDSLAAVVQAHEPSAQT